MKSRIKGNERANHEDAVAYRNGRDYGYRWAVKYCLQPCQLLSILAKTRDQAGCELPAFPASEFCGCDDAGGDPQFADDGELSVDFRAKCADDPIWLLGFFDGCLDVWDHELPKVL